jgi:hypothetical protein
MRPFRERYEQHARCPVRLWSVTPGVTTDNRGPSRTLIQQVTSRLGSSIGHRPVAYNDIPGPIPQAVDQQEQPFMQVRLEYSPSSN